MGPARLCTLIAALGAVAACETDRATAPPIPASVPAADGVALSLATILGSTVVDDPGVVGSHTSLVSGSDGVQRIAYHDATNQRLKYASCSANCTSAASWQQGVIDPALNTGKFASLKVRSGVRHVVYQAGAHMRYAACASNCLLEEGWKKGVIFLTGSFPSLAIGDEGRLHLSYVDVMQSRLIYVTCLSGCTLAANWHGNVVDGSLPSPTQRSRTSMAVGPDGRRHISYSAGGRLKYATCLSSCTNPANWQKLVVGPWLSDLGWFNSLAVDGNGVRHISHYDAEHGDLRYWRCPSNCTNSAGWKTAAIDRGDGTYGTDVGRYASLAVSGGKVHVSYYDVTGGRLKYASCSGGDCLLGASWQRQYVDGACVFSPCPGNVGGFTSLKLGGGRVHISYYNFTKGDLKYAELTQ